MTKRLQRNGFSKYRFYLKFTDHSFAMSQRAIIPKFANIVPALSHGVENISLGCGVRASLMLFFFFFELKIYFLILNEVVEYFYINTDSLLVLNICVTIFYKIEIGLYYISCILDC